MTDAAQLAASTNNDTEDITPWSDEDFLGLRRWYQLARARKLAHAQAARLNNKIFSLLALPSTIIGSVLSAVTISPDTAPQWVSTALSITMTVTTSVNNFYGFSKKAEAHRRVSKTFGLLMTKIEAAGLRRNNPTEEFNVFVEKLTAKFSGVLGDCPPLPPAAAKMVEQINMDAPSPFDSAVASDMVETIV